MVARFRLLGLESPLPERSRALRELEDILATGHELELATGYPFAATYDDMLAVDSRRGVAIVAGLFSDRATAVHYGKSHAIPGELVELRPRKYGTVGSCQDDDKPCGEPRFQVVETLAYTKAYARKDLDAMLERENGRPWVPFAQELAELERDLSALPVLCEVEAGRLFLVERGLGPRFSQIVCESGQEGWVSRRATRVQAVVTGTSAEPRISQVLAIECDDATLETRPFLTGSTQPSSFRFSKC